MECSILSAGALRPSTCQSNDKTGRTINKKRREYISGARTQAAIGVMRELTFKAFLVFARFGGLRPCEVRHLRFSDFEFYDNGFARFLIPQGKTGKRFVPISVALRPIVDLLFSAVSVKQECIIINQDCLLPEEKYRKLPAGEIGELIRKDIRKAGLPVWGETFHQSAVIIHYRYAGERSFRYTKRLHCREQ